MDFEDHFSGHADAYAQARPRYPSELFTWLAAISPDRNVAWDAGTGNGQVAVALARHFETVVATDASADQLARAEAHARVSYRNEPADRLSLPAGSVDLTTAGSAAHWFELEGFYDEVRRVMGPGGIVALFSYGPRDFANAVTDLLHEPILHRFQEEVLADFWPERIQLVHDRYATLPFPFVEIEAPQFLMTASWNLRELLAFLETWSAAQRYARERGTRATAAIERELAHAWGDPAQRRDLRSPLILRAGVVRE